MSENEKELQTEEIVDENSEKELETMFESIDKEKETVAKKSEASADTEESEENSEDSQEETKEKKKFFGKKKDKKDKQIEELTAKVEELTDRTKRTMAEFENFRKRTEKEKASMFDMGGRSIVEKLLPVLDNFERGLAAVPEENRSDAFVDGMDKVYKQMLKMLNDAGVEVIETADQSFDPNLHNAVMHVEDENLGENVIAQEFQKGYKYKGSVVRHSMVQVAN